MSAPLRVLFVCAMNKRRSVTTEHLYRNDARFLTNLPTGERPGGAGETGKAA